MEIYDLVDRSIAIIAIIISTIALVRGRRNTDKLIELEEIHAKLSKEYLDEFERNKKESTKAKINVRLEMTGHTGKFLIENKGLAVAEKIYFSLNEEGGHNPLAVSDFSNKNPYPSLHPGESYYLRANFPLSVTQKIYGVDMRWNSEDGTQHKKSFTVSR